MEESDSSLRVGGRVGPQGKMEHVHEQVQTSSSEGDKVENGNVTWFDGIAVGVAVGEVGLAVVIGEWVDGIADGESCGAVEVAVGEVGLAVVIGEWVDGIADGVSCGAVDILFGAPVGGTVTNSRALRFCGCWLTAVFPAKEKYAGENSQVNISAETFYVR